MFDNFDYKTEIQKRFDEQERIKREFEEERRRNLVPQGSYIPTTENGIVPAPSNPMRPWYDAQEKIRKDLDQQEQLKAQPDLMTGGNFEYQQPTRQAPYQPNKVATGLNETMPQEIPEDELQFNGQNLNWLNNNQIYKSWPAMSGNKDYQSTQYQNIANKGPLPEGGYGVNQDQLQSFDVLSPTDKAASWAGLAAKGFGKNIGPWPGATPTWGNHRVWLKPDENTNTYGRDNFSIHGGWSPGSAGCPDLTDKMDEFTKNFQNYGVNMKLRVKYPRGW